MREFEIWWWNMNIWIIVLYCNSLLIPLLFLLFTLYYIVFYVISQVCYFFFFFFFFSKSSLYMYQIQQNTWTDSNSLIRSRGYAEGCAGWSGPSLSAHAKTIIFLRHGFKLVIKAWNVKPGFLEKQIIEISQIVVCWICTESGKGLKNLSKGNKFETIS